MEKMGRVPNFLCKIFVSLGNKTFVTFREWLLTRKFPLEGFHLKVFTRKFETRVLTQYN